MNLYNITCYALEAHLVDDFYCHISTIEATIQVAVEKESDAQ